MKRLKTINGSHPNVHHGQPPQCTSFPLGKQVHIPFRKTEVLPEEIRDIVISDVCEPFKVSIGGYRYFVTWLELKKRLLSIEFTKNKECVTITDSLKHFMAWLLQQKKANVKWIRTNNSGEYTGKEFQNLCSKVGIIHGTTSPYTPKHNRTAEWYNRMLQEGALTICHEADLPAKFWVSAIHTVNFIRNQILHTWLSTSP